jgi:uncharacterized damage-inducible protein DinB
MMQAMFKQLFEFDHWANVALLASLDAQQPVAAAILDKLGHLVASNRIWLARVRQEDTSGMSRTASLPLDRCREELEALHREWLHFLADLSPDRLERTMSFTSLVGTPYTCKVKDIMLQVLHHHTYHRGQIATLMVGEQRKPPTTDYIEFVRQGGTAVSVG